MSDCIAVIGAGGKTTAVRCLAGIVCQPLLGGFADRHPQIPLKHIVSLSLLLSVAAGAWYANAVDWAAGEGIVSGYGNGKFGPEDNITREQMALILYGYAQYKGYDVSASGELSSFTDGASTSSWAAEAVQWAVGSGLLSGKGGGVLDPQGTATRAEAASIFMRFARTVME